jgi:hypothetical protein
MTMMLSSPGEEGRMGLCLEGVPPRWVSQKTCSLETAKMTTINRLAQAIVATIVMERNGDVRRDATIYHRGQRLPHSVKVKAQDSRVLVAMQKVQRKSAENLVEVLH